MKFLDLSKNPAAEVELTLTQIQELIQRETGRELRFSDPNLAQTYDSRFKLIKFPSPLGFAVAAAVDIPKGSLLFPYGGDTKKIAAAAKKPSDNTEYLFRTELPHGFLMEGQAQNHGDLGSLAIHLPNHEFLEQMDINATDQDKIQQENIGNVCLDNDKPIIYHVALRDIKANTLLGFNYGMTYWIGRGVSPILFENDSFKVLDLVSISFIGMAAFRDKETQSTRLRSLTENPGGELCGIPMVTLLRFFSDRSNKELLAPYFMMTLSLHVAIKWATLSTTIQQSMVVAPAGRKVPQPKSLITFFDTIPVVTCAPPPGSRIVDNRTIAPKVV
jgi:hypothetical protein